MFDTHVGLPCQGKPINAKCLHKACSFLAYRLMTGALAERPPATDRRDRTLTPLGAAYARPQQDKTGGFVLARLAEKGHYKP
jgi:hypothetical protein